MNHKPCGCKETKEGRDVCAWHMLLMRKGKQVVFEQDKQAPYTGKEKDAPRRKS